MIREKHSPEIDQKLKNQREKNILMEDLKKSQVKYTMKNQKKNRILLKKKEKIQNLLNLNGN